MGIHPGDDVTGLRRVVLPEEKMADHEEQLSEEEKVRCQFQRHTGSGGDVALGFCVAPDSVCLRLPAALNSKEKTRQASARRRLLLILFLAQLPLICDSQTEAPCTVLTQNRSRAHIRNSPELVTRWIFAPWTCRLRQVGLVSRLTEVFIHQTSAAIRFSIAAIG